MRIPGFIRPWDSQPQSAEQPRGEFTPAGVWIPAYGTTLWTPAGRIQATVNTAAYTASPAGVARAGNGSSTLLNWALPSWATGAPLVLGGVFVVQNTSTTTQSAIAIGGLELSSGLYGAIGQGTSAGTVASWIRQTIAGPAPEVTGPSAVVGQVYAAVRISRAVNDHVMFVNGVRYSSTDSGINFDGGSWRNFSIGASVRDTTPIFYGAQSVALAVLARTDPGDGWLREFSLRPWATTFEPRRIFVPVAAAAGGPPDPDRHHLVTHHDDDGSIYRDCLNNRKDK